MAFSVICGGDLSIRHVSQFRSSILNALATEAAIVIDVAESSRPDLSFLQLIESARMQAGIEGKSITLAAPAKGALFDALTRAGFLEEGRAQDRGFWLHEGDAS